jgi:methionyl-tRNA formyltransferase
MRIAAFLSDPIFSPPILQALTASHHEVVVVVTTPNVARGRGMKFSPTVPAQMAEQSGIPVLKPAKLRDEGFLANLAAFKPDACVVAAYPKLIPSAVLDLPSRGFWNVHPSLLPRWRGAAPVQRAIMAGDTVTGVTIMRMVEKMDAGEILLQESIPIQPSEDGEELMLRLANLGAKLLIKALDTIETGNYTLTPQDESQVTLAPKLNEEEARLDWDKSCAEVLSQIRGMHPNLTAYSFWRGKRLQIFKAQSVATNASMALPPPGSMVTTKNSLSIACRDGMIDLLSIRVEGKNIISGVEFARGARLEPGEMFASDFGGDKQ